MKNWVGRNILNKHVARSVQELKRLCLEYSLSHLLFYKLFTKPWYSPILITVRLYGTIAMAKYSKTRETAAILDPLMCSTLLDGRLPMQDDQRKIDANKLYETQWQHCPKSKRYNLHNISETDFMLQKPRTKFLNLVQWCYLVALWNNLLPQELKWAEGISLFEGK